LTWFVGFINDVKLKIRQRRSYQIAAVIIGLLLLLKLAESGLNLLVRRAFYQSLIQESGPDTRVQAQVARMSLGDLMAGRFHKIILNGTYCRVNGVKLKRLLIDSAGFTLDLNVLFSEKQLLFKAIGRTMITAVITETAVTEYFGTKYSRFKPRINFTPGRLGITGETDVWGKVVPLQLEGLLQINPPKTLRFYPERLQVANRSVSRNFLKFLGDRVPLETTVLEKWPFQIKTLTLKQGLIEIVMAEIGF
jgi:hypothetical protein